MSNLPSIAVYGAPPRDLADVPAGAVQVSPLVPGSAALEDLSGLSQVIVHAPPGSLERRYVLALALKALVPGGRLTALAAKDKGGSRIKKELQAFDCAGEEFAKRHHRIFTCVRPETQNPSVDRAIAEGGRLLGNGALWTQPGIFSWDRIDPGSRLLAERLPALSGRGADLGCGAGYLAKHVLASESVTEVHLVDIDRRAIDSARRNVTDPRAAFHWADATREPPLEDLDFVVMNPPFHSTGVEDRGLGQGFIRRSAAILRSKGVLWLVANRHLPYELVLREAFREVHSVAEVGGYKVFEALR